MTHYEATSEAQIERLHERVAELEVERHLLLEALWLLLDGREIVVLPSDGTRAISISTTDDGGFLVRRAALSQEEQP